MHGGKNFCTSPQCAFVWVGGVLRHVNDWESGDIPHSGKILRGSIFADRCSSTFPGFNVCRHATVPVCACVNVLILWV